MIFQTASHPQPASSALPTAPEPLDVVVVGAGLAGLICAQRLQQAGLRVLVVEKSRGLGGRMATRRLQNTCADHGLRYLTQQGPLTDQLISILLDQDVLQPWIEVPSGLAYRAATGLTVVAKWLAAGLEIHLGQRLDCLNLVQAEPNLIWQLSLHSTQASSQAEPISLLWAKAVVLAIPAPQAQTLVEPLIADGLDTEWVAAIRAVEFAPCITAIASYDNAARAALASFPQGCTAVTADIAWLSQEHTKGRTPAPVLVLQSTADFARCHLETPDLMSLGHLLLEQLAGQHPDLEQLQHPLTLQMHRWRYGLVQQPLPNLCLSTALPAPLACGGDWCGGTQAEAALTSGWATAATVMTLLGINELRPEQPGTAGQFSTLLEQLRWSS